MTRKALRASIALAVVLLVAFAFAADIAHAASDFDKEMASREGVSESLATKDFDEDQMPGKKEVGLAVGSIIAMIAVIKYL